MTIRSGKAVAAGVVAFVVSSFAAYNVFVVAPEKERAKKAFNDAAKDVDEKRFAEWARVVKKKEISPGEFIRLVVIPRRVGDFSSTRCFIYTNAEYKTSSMICPESAQDPLSDEN